MSAPNNNSDSQTKYKIRIFDTTLRDGEQSPGFSMTLEEKLKVAKHLDRLGVDTIEAGFPITSEDDFEAVKKIAQTVKNAEVCGLARAVKKDIQRAWDAVKYSSKPVIHTFLATSPIHRKYKLKKNKQQILEMAVEAVSFAKSLGAKVIFSPEDGSRTEPEFLYEVITSVIKAGAETINIPDTVGYATPEEFKELFENILKNVEGSQGTVFSTHCQNDLGLATANSLAGVLGGAKEIQCTINGIGERAGNASLEEVVMAIETRKDFYNFETNINTKEIYPISRLIQTITGVPVQPNKAIVGANAFAHESGIHQDGVLKHRETYEIMNPEMIGLDKNKIVLGKHSGRHALKERLKELGFDFQEEKLTEYFDKFKALADKKKQIFDEDLYLIVVGQEMEGRFSLFDMTLTCGTIGQPHAIVILKDKEKGQMTASCVGDGPVDAIYGAINKIVSFPNTLLEYSVNAVTEGIDAQATVSVKIQVQEKIFSGVGSSTDITVASCQAYLEAINRSLKFV